MDNIIKKRIKPDLTIYSTNQLENIIIEYYNDKNILEENKINIKNNSRNELEKIINDLWKNYQIVDDNNIIIDCSICLQPIINSDNMILSCEHILHSSCLLNYIYTNVSSNSTSNNIFKCPKCRNYLTELITDKSNNNNNNNDNYNNYNNYNDNNDNDYDYDYDNDNNNDNDYNIDIDLITGFWTRNNNNNNNNNIENNIIILSNYSSDYE